MAQYYQVTSLEELQRIYPNLQIDNVDGVQCMVPDDQVTQYTDGQGQQVITTVEQSGMQLSQNASSPQQCTSQQSQFVVQPAQYVIQQMEINEPQGSGVQLIQQTHQVPVKEDEVSEVEFKEQAVGEIANEECSLQQCIVKPENNQQYVPQVQSILHQPIQIHSQVQTVEMGGNVLVLQNQDQEVIMNINKGPEVISNQNQQQQQNSPDVIRQGKQLGQEDENPSQQHEPQQILQNRRNSQPGGQQQQIIQQPQQIIQQLQYYCLDNFSQPNVTIEHHIPSNDNLGQQRQIQEQAQQTVNQQQFKQKKNMQQTALPTIIQQQPQQIIIPHRFDMSSPPPLATRISQPRKKSPQEEPDNSAPVLIVQKFDNPFLVRQPQAKFRCPTAPFNQEKRSENSYLQLEEVNRDTQQFVQSPSGNVQQTDVHPKTITAGFSTPASKVRVEINPSCGQLNLNTGEQSVNKNIEQMNKSKTPPAILTKSPAARVKTTDQQTETVPLNERNEPPSPQMLPHSQPPPGITMSPQLPGQIQQHLGQGRGRGLRGQTPGVQSSRGGHQYVPRPRGAQTAPPRPPKNVEGNPRRLKSPRGGSRGGRGGLVPCGLEQRQPPPMRPGTAAVIQTSPANGETTQNTTEPVEEARMVVLLLNGEKKMIRLPCSQQSIILSQLLQQAGVTFSTQISPDIEQVSDTSNAEPFIIKAGTLTHLPQSVIAHKSPNVTITGAPPSPGASPRSIVTSIQQQRPRAQSPRLPQAPPLIRHRLQFSPRLCSPVPQSVSSPNAGSECVTAQVVTIQSTSPNSASSKDPLEDPRFLPGFVAICPYCGISSLDFNKCIRCRRKLPENVKTQSIFSVKKKRLEKGCNDKSNDDKRPDLDDKLSDENSSDGREKNSLQGYDKKKSRACFKRKKITDEPTEILILSSDDEDDSKSEKTDVNLQPLLALGKEPTYLISDINEAEMPNTVKENSIAEDLLKCIQLGCFTTVQCRTIRVGSYKVQPKDRVLISTKGIRMVINSLNNEPTTIVIPLISILKALAHFGKQLPVIFLYPIPKVAFQIRNLLGMNDKSGPYYDPASTDEETHKRITLLLDKVHEENKITIIKIFGQGKLEELSEKEANDILIRASPIEVSSNIIKPLDGVRKIMVYPPPPEKGGITLNNQDYACLGEDQFLNDVIIDFYLKYLMLKVLSPEDRNRTHVFSTFFYKRLTTKPKTMRKNDPENDPKLSPAEKRHMRVKGWTKQVNLFEKDFIIVPINEHSHWFLAIICFPGLSGPVRFSDNSPVELEEVVHKKSTQTVQIGSTTITHIIKSEGHTISMETDSGSDRDEAEGDQDDLHPSSDDESEQAEDEQTTAPATVQIPLLTALPQPQLKDLKIKPVKKKAVKEPIKQPCILIFDSLAGASRVRVVATLRDYLKIEYKKKMGKDREFSKDTIKGAVPKVPQQSNFTDCGLYVLQYVESFFQDPLHDFKLPLKYLQDWFPEEVVSCKRQKLANLIKSLMEEQGIKVEEQGLPTLTFANGKNLMQEEPSKMEEEEEGEEEEEEEEINEDDEMLRGRVQITEFENEDEDDMDLEDDEDDDELDDEDEEDLEVGEIRKRWLTRRRGSFNELEAPLQHVGGHILVKTSPLVAYEASDSEEEECSNMSNSSGMMTGVQTPFCSNFTREFCEPKQRVVSEANVKSVPLTEYQDFESQISCTTIEKNFDCKNNESDMAISEDEDVEGEGEEEEEVEEEEEEVVEEDDEYGETVNEEEVSFENPEMDNTVTSTFNQSFQSGENKHFQSKGALAKDNKTMNIIKKLVNDKSITFSRREDDLNSSLYKKQLELKRFNVSDCDKSEEVKKVTSSCVTPKPNIATCKRSYQALKSVRIPKKADRKIEFPGKRQKVEKR